MADLDYAFLAEYAKVEPGGNLTAVGASFTHLGVSGFPAQQLLSIAGRIRARVGEAPSLRVTFVTPNDTFTIEAEMQLAAGPAARPYGPDRDMLGFQFAMSLMAPLTEEGFYRVDLRLDGEHVRMLAFTAETRVDQA